MATLRTQWQRIQNYIWLVCGLVCLFAALIFWAITDSDALVEVEKSAETESELQIQPEKVAATSLLGALQEEVRPLEMTTRVVNTGSYDNMFCFMGSIEIAIRQNRPFNNCRSSFPSLFKLKFRILKIMLPWSMIWAQMKWARIANYMQSI
jgi:hypothetical protein